MFSQAIWIWGSKACLDDEYFDFYLSFEGKSGDHRLNISADSNYAIYKGEELVAFGQYGDYPDYKVYDEIDLNGFVSEGENEFIITVWHEGKDSQTYIRKPAGVIFELLEDGKAIVSSSADTPSRRSKGFIPHRSVSITSQLGLTFAYDANDIGGDFQKSFEVKGLPVNLVKRPIKKLEIKERFLSKLVFGGGFKLMGGDDDGQLMQRAALSFTANSGVLNGSRSVEFSCGEGEDGVYLISDMGRETAGFIEFEIDVPEECDVLVGWGEHLIDGRCRTTIGSRNFSFRFRAKKGKNRFMNPLRRMGARYVQMFILSKEAVISVLTMRETIYPLDVKPYATDNILRKSIYDVCVNTLRQCMHEHYEDCPWREQALYTMDSRNQMLCGYYTFGETAFPRACLELISHGLRKDGLLSLCFPAGLDFPIPMFSLVYFIQMREYLDHSKDIAFVGGKYDFLKKLMDTFLEKQREDGLIYNFTGENFWNFYEWSEGMSGRLRDEHVQALEAPLNAFLSIALQNLSYIAQMRGSIYDAEYYADMAARINKSIRKEFFDEKAKLFISFDNRCRDQYSVLTNSVCLLCGAADDVDKENIIKILTQNGAGELEYNVVPNTLSMNSFRFDALLNLDKEKYAPVILEEIDRVYFEMLKDGATTFWETIDGASDFGSAGSLCHGWSALPAYYYMTLDQ